MHDTQVSVSVPLSRLFAWVSWGSVALLLTIGCVAHVIALMDTALALSAVAATLHIRCFCIRLSNNIRMLADMVQQVRGPVGIPQQPPPAARSLSRVQSAED